MTAILHELAAANGGYLTSVMYREQCNVISDLPTLYRICESTPPGWKRLCEVVGISCHFSDTLPDVLSETDILRLMDMGAKQMQKVPITHRQQMVIYCLKKIYPVVGELYMSQSVYNRVAHEHNLFGGWFAERAFGTWTDALSAACLPVDPTRLRPTLRKARNPRAQEATVARCTEADFDGHEVVAPDWKTAGGGLEVANVTEVTQVYAIAPGVGLRHSEVRMMLR